MAAKIIKEFHGHSGSHVYLMQDETGPYVYKKGSVERNVERIRALSGKVRVPVIYKSIPASDELYMEYIHGLDMKNYLKAHSPTTLINFLKESLNIFSAKEIDKDYTEVYYENLKWMDDGHPFPFSKDELIAKLPKMLPQSTYHGDMTLENIIFSEQGHFFFIDPVTTPYDSWVFDIAKLRQDLECRWFLRNDPIMLDVKLKTIQESILLAYPIAYNDYLLILMLLRVFRHCDPNELEYDFVVREVKRLWK